MASVPNLDTGGYSIASACLFLRSDEPVAGIGGFRRPFLLGRYRYTWGQRPRVSNFLLTGYGNWRRRESVCPILRILEQSEPTESLIRRDSQQSRGPGTKQVQ